MCPYFWKAKQDNISKYKSYNSNMYNVNDPTSFQPLAADNEFVQNLRTALTDSYNAGMANLDNQRQLDQNAIMNKANKAGVMFSNIPQRMKIQYDTQTYMPAQVKLRNSYQTGLDSLRQNGINAANQVAYYQQMIDHYNNLPTSGTTTSNVGSASEIANAVEEALQVD